MRDKMEASGRHAMQICDVRCTAVARAIDADTMKIGSSIPPAMLRGKGAEAMCPVNAARSAQRALRDASMPCASAGRRVAASGDEVIVTVVGRRA